MQQLAGASISPNDIFERYKTACNLKQPIDRNRVTSAIFRWAVGIGIPSSTTMRFVDSETEVEEAARIARVAWDAWAARAVWASWTARAARMAAQNAWDARVALKARVAWSEENPRWAARIVRDVWTEWIPWDLPWIVTMAIGASSIGDQTMLKKWLPLLEAFEAGCFCLWIGKDTIYAAVIPTKVTLDDSRRLHCSDGPAITWLAYIRQFYWHGVNVPEFVIERPQHISLKIIDKEQNAEVRRVMIERYRHDQEIKGAAAYVRDAGGIRLDHDDGFGTLWRRELGDDEPIVMLEVVNSTPEPDGQFKKYFLRVPPTVTKAKEAVAWTFNIRPDEYAPLVET